LQSADLTNIPAGAETWKKLIHKVKLGATYHVSLIAYFMDKLKAIPDGDGTLLDHSLVVFGVSMSNGNVHNHSPLPVFAAGGPILACGAVVGGRFRRNEWKYRPDRRGEESRFRPRSRSSETARRCQRSGGRRHHGVALGGALWGQCDCDQPLRRHPAIGRGAHSVKRRRGPQHASQRAIRDGADEGVARWEPGREVCWSMALK
jgi:hypothetical protein